MRINLHPLRCIALVAAAALFLETDAQADSAVPLPTTYADPAVPLLQLPTNFRARRTSANLSMAPGRAVEIFNTTGAGCPYRDNRGRLDQDGVFYRFFGPDPIPFRSSLIFTSAARPDDYEAVSYFYKVPGSKAPPFVAPQDWQVVGPFPDGSDMEAFKKPADELVRQLSQGIWPERIKVSTNPFTTHKLTPKYGWVRLEGVYQTRYPYPRTDQSVYVRGTLTSGSKRRAKLRIGLDNWAIVYLNGQQVAMLDHADAFDVAKIPITLNKGVNQLLIKTNNRQNRERHLWALHCAVE